MQEGKVLVLTHSSYGGGKKGKKNENGRMPNKELLLPREEGPWGRTQVLISRKKKKDILPSSEEKERKGKRIKKDGEAGFSRKGGGRDLLTLSGREKKKKEHAKRKEDKFLPVEERGGREGSLVLYREGGKRGGQRRGGKSVAKKGREASFLFSFSWEEKRGKVLEGGWTFFFGGRRDVSPDPGSGAKKRKDWNPRKGRMSEFW